MGFENYGIDSGKLLNPGFVPNFNDISEPFPEENALLLDQRLVKLKNLTVDQRHWQQDGYLIKRHFLDHKLIDQYIDIRNKLNLGFGPFPDITLYLYHSVIRDMCCSPELHYLLVDLIGEELGLHFILADFKSTERGWHQDDYLNPEDTRARYVAVWMAMGDIDMDAGPFEIIPGSHKWQCLRKNKVQELVVPELRGRGDHEWAIVAEHSVNKSVERHIAETKSEIVKFDAKKGDILIWHGKTMHRGSIPNNPNLMRPAMICHYSNVRSRRDFGNEITRHGNGGYFWEFESMGRTLREDQFPRVEQKSTKSLSDRFEGLWPRMFGRKSPALARK
jgi:hypothetical protein